MNNSGMENSQGIQVAKLQAQDWNPTPWDCLVPRSAWPAYSRIYSWDCVFPGVRKHCTFHVRIFHFHHKTSRNSSALFDSRARLKVLILVGRERKTEQPSLVMPAHLLQHSSPTTDYLWYFPPGTHLTPRISYVNYGLITTSEKTRLRNKQHALLNKTAKTWGLATYTPKAVLICHFNGDFTMANTAKK